MDAEVIQLYETPRGPVTCSFCRRQVSAGEYFDNGMSHPAKKVICHDCVKAAKIKLEDTLHV